MGKTRETDCSIYSGLVFRGTEKRMKQKMEGTALFGVRVEGMVIGGASIWIIRGLKYIHVIWKSLDLRTTGFGFQGVDTLAQHGGNLSSKDLLVPRAVRQENTRWKARPT